eukprot:446738_1
MSADATTLSTAQSETYAMLLNMGFEGQEAVSAARIFGSDVSAAVNYLTSEPPQASVFYYTEPTQPKPNTKKQHKDSHKSSTHHPPEPHTSPDDIAINQLLDRIGTTMTTFLHDKHSHPSSKIQSKATHINHSKKDKPVTATPYVPKSKEEVEFDEKTNEQIKNITKRLSLTQEQLQSQAMIGKAVWFGDILSLREYPSCLMNALDEHGNTALSLACRLGHDSVSHAILEMGADPMIELASGWNIIQEAVLHKDARLVRDLLIHQIQLRGNKYEARNKEIIAHLQTMPDFSLEISWQITSTLAVLNNLIAKFAKIDNFKIWKKGTAIRFDMFMKGFSAQGVEKGHVSFVFSECGTLTIDHDRKTFTNAIRKYKNPDWDEMEREIRVLMRTEQGRASLRTSDVVFERKKGWMGGDKTEQIEGFQCDVVSTKNLSHSIIEDKRKGDESKNRWQHPTFEEYFDGTRDGYDAGDNEDQVETGKKEKKRRFSLKKYSKKNTFDKRYFPSYIYRKDQPVDVTLWLCQNYPLSDTNISILLEAISIASEDMRRLADIFKLKFPGGFPVKLTMPIVVGISASATFCNFQRANIPDTMFEVP